MPSPSFALIAVAAAVLTSASAPAAPELQDRTVRATFSQRVIIRIPRMAPRPRSARVPAREQWEERRADRCVATERLSAAAVTERGSVDFLTSDGQRMRAKLDRRCPTLDFYSGFYIRQPSDGRICARRDSIRTRSGATCEIERFRKLVLDD